MAFTLPLLTPQRVVAGYQRLIRMEFDAFDEVVRLTVAHYVDEQAREAELPVWHDHVAIPFSRFAVDPIALGYGVLKQYEDGAYLGAPGDTEGQPERVFGLVSVEVAE